MKFYPFWGQEKPESTKLFFTSSLVIEIICFLIQSLWSLTIWGENVMEEEKRFANMAPSNKVLAIISCD
jgi:hypothetical protein